MMQAPDSVRMRKSSAGIHLLGIGLARLAATQLSGSNKNANRRKPSAVLFGIGHRRRLGMRHERSTIPSQFLPHSVAVSFC